MSPSVYCQGRLEICSLYSLCGLPVALDLWRALCCAKWTLNQHSPRRTQPPALASGNPHAPICRLTVASAHVVQFLTLSQHWDQLAREIIETFCIRKGMRASVASPWLWVIRKYVYRKCVQIARGTRMKLWYGLILAKQFACLHSCCFIGLPRRSNHAVLFMFVCFFPVCAYSPYAHMFLFCE